MRSMLRRLTLAIPEETAAKLAEMARREYRAPKDQAAILLIEAIERSRRPSFKASER